MARDSIFKSTQAMPPHSGSNDVVRTAMSPGDVVNISLTEGGMRRTRVGAALMTGDESVKHVERPVRGRPY
jgi:hypothetical protein